MAYFKPYIDATGPHIPSYADVLAKLVDDYKSVYGSDVYLDNDSADYQWLSITALRIFDVFQTFLLACDNQSPTTAIGAGLDKIVSINGLTRSGSTFSTCLVRVTGTAYTNIIGGAVGDQSGNQWNLPYNFTIPAAGFIDVVATCNVRGAITALSGQLTKILTPTAGWVSVTNSVAAVSGRTVETDSALRARQAASVSLPSLTLAASTTAAIKVVPNVGRVQVYENATANADSNGIPARSICCVVEGGSDSAVAGAIYAKKGWGCATFGGTSVNVVDDYDSSDRVINFQRPVQTNIYVTLNIQALTNYTTAVSDNIKDAVVAYINSLKIGQKVLVNTGIANAVISAIGDITNPYFSIQSLYAGTAPSPSGSSDISIAYNAVALGAAANITVNVA